MRFIWKVLLIIIPLGGYWLYKKSSSSSHDAETQPSGMGKSNSPPKENEKKEEVSTTQIIERLAEIDGVTSRVAENLTEKGIRTQEDLAKLSRDELMEIKGIGPKRAEKILKL